MSTKLTPYKEHKIKVSNMHTLYVAEFGNPEGIPVLTVHGGPGSKSKPKHLKIYDLEKCRLIQFDQRGCGESMPQGEIRENTINDLVEDIEIIRNHLLIDMWVITGGSWGSTVALLYATRYPDKVLGIFLRSIFLARKQDAMWLNSNDGAAKFFPDLWNRRQGFLDKKEISENNASEYFLDVLINGSLTEKQEITAIIEDWEGNIMSPFIDFSFTDPGEVTGEDMNSAKIFCHYDANNFFLEENEILNNIDEIANVPVYILHGRYDMVCPVEQACVISEKLPKSVLKITQFDGHKLGADADIISKMMFENLIDSISE